MSEKFERTTKVAKFLNLSCNRVTELVREGKLISIKHGKNTSPHLILWSSAVDYKRNRRPIGRPYKFRKGDRLVSIEDTANVLKLSLERVLELIKNSKLKAVRFGDGKYDLSIIASSLSKYLNEHCTEIMRRPERLTGYIKEIPTDFSGGYEEEE